MKATFFATLTAAAVAAVSAIQAEPQPVEIEIVDAGRCFNEAYNAARNDVTNDIINQATIDLAKTPSEYNWQAAGEWRDFYGVVFPGCEEGELNEAWRTSYEDEYKRYRLTILKDTYDGVWADRAPLSPSSGAAAALREVKRRMEIRKRHGTQW